MVMSFFRRGESGMQAIAGRTVHMLADARHSFDLANMAVVGGADPVSVAADIRSTDGRINEAEQELRGELVTHVAVHGGSDIGMVLNYTLLIKKVERIGDQAKNILDLAEEGVSFAGEDDATELSGIASTISAMFGEAGDLLSGSAEAAADFQRRADELRRSIETRIREYMHSEAPGHYAVPRAVLYRYWKRVVANLAGVVTSATEPLKNVDYLDHGATDITDD